MSATNTPSQSTIPTGAELREAIMFGDLDCADAVLILNPERAGYGPVIYPWEVLCGSAEPAEDCRIVTGANSSSHNWCYACWLKEVGEG